MKSVRYAETHGVNNRIAAYMLAIDRFAMRTEIAWDLRLRKFSCPNPAVLNL